MQGLELSRRFFFEAGLPALEAACPELLPRLAFGLCGSGSECWGWDDECSRDHDFEPGFCIFLPSEELVSRREEFLLERVYAKLPREFLGHTRSLLNPAGGNRHGVLRTADFFSARTGFPAGPETLSDWLQVPEYALSEAVNGQVFLDSFGEFSGIRQRLAEMPRDIRLKKLAGCLVQMVQSGLYNYPRCLNRGEPDAARLSAVEFAENAMHAAFLLENRYMPYYKWRFRALRELPVLSGLESCFSALLRWEEVPVQIGRICAVLADTLRQQGYTELPGSDPEPLAEELNRQIADNWLRNLSILAAV